MVQWYCVARKVYNNEGYFFKVLCLQAADHDCYLELSALVRCKSYPKDWRFQIKPDIKHMPVAINISFGDHGTTCFRGAQAGHKQIAIHPRTPQLYALNHHRSHIDGPKQRTGGHVGVPRTSQANPVSVELVSYPSTFFCSNELVRLLALSENVQ